jgi:outer membrane receptor protein involved in Fe transport
VSCVFLTAAHSALAQQSATPAPTTTTAELGSSENLDEIVVNGIKRGDLILPTTVTSTSAYGLDLGVMDTPRNNSLISKAQLDALNIQNPGGFSYLTSSSYADAAFGQPNVPRIRGQYGDIFYNGMRDSFTLNGYGAPISFNDVDSIDIVKGTASVQQGPGAGVGGSIGITTKMPSFTKWSEAFELEFDSQQKRRASFDVGGPISSNTAARVSFASDDSGSYYYDMYFHQQSLYAAVLTNFTDQYSVLVTGEAVDTRYRENDGVNRVNQALIDNGAYLTGAPPAATISDYLTPVTLGGTVQLNDRILIDEPAGTGAHSLHAKAQIIQTFKASDAFTITNNTLYDYLNRYNQTEDYYADTAKGSYTLENKTDFKVKFALGSVSNQIDAGFTYRFEHVNDVQNEANEPVMVFDLSGNPNTWVYPAALQSEGGAVPYLGAFGHPQYGTGVLNPFYMNNSVIDNLQDGGIFLEHRIQFSPQWSMLYGLREDIVQLNEQDPLAGVADFNVTGEPENISTGWYGLHNGNISVVYSPTSHVSAYLTYTNAQYVDPNANDGAIGTYGGYFEGSFEGVANPTAQLRQNSDLEEAGLKFDLLDKSLFVSTAIFKQTRAVPTGDGGSQHSTAHIKGAEIELNYQPGPNFFATASYSYLHTVLDVTPGNSFTFYNFPAQPGPNIDGAGSLATYNSNQRLSDPGVPQHLFNVLANYKHESGFGAQANIQVTGPITTTPSGYLNVAATNASAAEDGITQPLIGAGGLISNSVVAANGYYKSPTIPWQYTLNAGVFYTYAERYTLKFMVYNVTSQHNLVNDYPFYGNDFLTRVPPRSYDLTLSGKF